MGAVTITADLCFSLELPGQEPVRGSVTGSGNRLEVRLSDPAYFAGGRDAARLRSLAATLAGLGVTVVVIAGDVVLLEIGATETSWWQRRLTRSRHLKVASLRGAVTGVAGRVKHVGAAAVLPGSALVPPTTPFPIFPTFGRTPRPATTTHDPRRGGNPRLVATVDNARMPDDGTIVFPLRRDVTTIGSDRACDIVLAGLDPIHAVIVHDENDELVLHDRSTDRTTTVHGVPADGRVLRTGARIVVGGWRFTYRRAEYADHGRPYGGRIGGELGHQRPQRDPRRGTPQPRGAHRGP